MQEDIAMLQGHTSRKIGARRFGLVSMKAHKCRTPALRKKYRAVLLCCVATQAPDQGVKAQSEIL